MILLILALNMEKYTGGVLTLVSLVRVWNFYSNTPTDKYSCVLIFWLNLCWFNLKKILDTDSIS